MTADHAYARADWSRIEALYEQHIRVIDTGKVNNELAGRLAKGMARTCAAYDGEEELFVLHLQAVIASVEEAKDGEKELFKRLYKDGRYSKFAEYRKQDEDDRRRPTPFEAAVESCRRLRDVNRLREQLAPVPTGCILGGSASYGRFYNTVGDRDNEPSDLDLLVVVKDYAMLPALVEPLERVAGFGAEELDTLRARIGHFPGVREKRQGHCIFSHKLKLWPPDSPDPFLAKTGIDGEYAVSIHVLSGDDFDYVILRDEPRLDRGRKILDYRQSKPNKADIQRSFAETQFMDESKSWNCKGGYLVESSICSVEAAGGGRGSRYYPGQHQNLILPEFELRWDLPSHRLYLPIYSFKVKLWERLEAERVQRPYEIQNLANSHTRRYHFAPYITVRQEAG